MTYKCKKALNESFLIKEEWVYPDGKTAGSSIHEKTDINSNIWDDCHEERNIIPSPETLTTM